MFGPGVLYNSSGTLSCVSEIRMILHMLWSQSQKGSNNVNILTQQKVDLWHTTIRYNIWLNSGRKSKYNVENKVRKWCRTSECRMGKNQGGDGGFIYFFAHFLLYYTEGKSIIKEKDSRRHIAPLCFCMWKPHLEKKSWTLLIIYLNSAIFEAKFYYSFLKTHNVR